MGFFDRITGRSKAPAPPTPQLQRCPTCNEERPADAYTAQAAALARLEQSLTALQQAYTKSRSPGSFHEQQLPPELPATVDGLDKPFYVSNVREMVARAATRRAVRAAHVAMCNQCWHNPNNRACAHCAQHLPASMFPPPDTGDEYLLKIFDAYSAAVAPYCVHCRDFYSFCIACRRFLFGWDVGARQAAIVAPERPRGRDVGGIDSFYTRLVAPDEPPPRNPTEGEHFRFERGYKVRDLVRCRRCTVAYEEKRLTEELAKLGAAPSPTTGIDNAVILGTTSDGHAVSVPGAVRNRHCYIIGKTGSGKSSLLRNLIMQDMEAGRGLIYIDPHGDTAAELLGYVPQHRRDDVTYFCPTDEQAPAFNLLAADYAPDKLTRDMVSAIKMFFGDSWGPRLNQLLTNALATLLLDRQHEPHTLADLETMLIDPDYRAQLLARCRNDKLKTFWNVQFPTMSKDAVNPVLNKLSDLLMPMSPMERIFSARGNSLDLARIMNEGKILLCNLSKGELGEAGAFLIGGLLVTSVAQAALARVRIPEAERRDVFLYVDEFQNFTIDSFESILSEARKYRLNLTLAHQYLNQVPANLQAAIFGNVGAVVCLPISAADATTMRRELATTRAYEEGTHTLYDPIAYSRGWTYDNYHKAIVANLPSLTARVAQQHPAWWAACEARQAIAFPLPIDPALWDSRTPEALVEGGHYVDICHEIATRVTFHTGQYNLGVKSEESDWPDTQDFLTLPPLAGFVKLLTPENVQRFTISHPSERPSEQTKRAILERQHAPRSTEADERAAAERLADLRAAEQQGRAGIAPAPTPATKPKAKQPGTDPDDFWT